jgi:hypothetical protein
MIKERILFYQAYNANSKIVLYQGSGVKAAQATAGKEQY